MPAPTDTGRSTRFEERVLLVVFALLLWWTRFTPPEHPATPDLDPSWAQALGYALVHGLRFGHDVVFTYGPLGWFAHAAWQPELLGWKLLAFEGAFKLALCALLAHALTRLPGTIEKLVCALFLLVPDPGLEAFYFAAVIAIAARLLETAPRGVARSVPLWAMLAVIAWMKFTYLLLAVAAAGLVLFDVARAGERKRALLGAGAFAALLLVLWIACRQSLLDLPAYLAGSWELSRGYSEAMSQAAPSLDHALAIASLALGALAVVLASAPLGRARVAARLLLFAAGAFVAYKAGFVSSGSTTITCFGYAFWAPWLLARRDGVPVRAARFAIVARALAVVVASWGYQRAQDASDGGTGRPFAAWNDRLAANLAEIRRLPVLREAYRLEREALRSAYDLPRIRERVGSSEADVIGSELGVLFLNDIAWRPRPVIQSYAAYTEALARRNAEHFASESAPRFVLLRFSTLDSRLPALDDGPALRELLVRYRALFEEQGYLLLERRASPRDVPPARVVVDREIGFDEELVLPPGDRRAGHAGVLAIDVRPSLLGRVRGFLSSTPRVEIAVRTEQGLEAAFRLVIGSARAGVLVDPWMLGQEAWDDAFCGVAKDRVVAFRVTCADADRSAFAPEIRVRYEAHTGLLPPPDRELASVLESSMFDRTPSSKRATIPFTRTVVDGKSALLVHAPSELAFAPGAGRWRVEAGFGLLAGAWEPSCTDGAVFVLAIRTPRGDGGLWRRRLEPERVEADRGTQRIVQEIELGADAELLLRTNVGAAGNGACDWCYWTDVRFVRVADASGAPGASR